MSDLRTATERLEDALDVYRGEVYAEAQAATLASVAQFVEDQQDAFQDADKGEWSCIGLACKIREEFDLEAQADPDRFRWLPLSSPPDEAGVYQLWLGDGSAAPVVCRFFDPARARNQRGDPHLAHVKNTWLFGWTNLGEGATHWRPMSEGPEE